MNTEDYLFLVNRLDRLAHRHENFSTPERQTAALKYIDLLTKSTKRIDDVFIAQDLLIACKLARGALQNLSFCLQS